MAKQQVYLPQSDCECYQMALDLLDEGLAPIKQRISEAEEDINNIESVLGYWTATYNAGAMRITMRWNNNG